MRVRTVAHPDFGADQCARLLQTPTMTTAAGRPGPCHEDSRIRRIGGHHNAHESEHRTDPPPITGSLAALLPTCTYRCSRVAWAQLTQLHRGARLLTRRPRETAVATECPWR